MKKRTGKKRSGSGSHFKEFRTHVKDVELQDVIDCLYDFVIDCYDLGEAPFMVDFLIQHGMTVGGMHYLRKICPELEEAKDFLMYVQKHMIQIKALTRKYDAGFALKMLQFNHNWGRESTAEKALEDKFSEFLAAIKANESRHVYHGDDDKML